MSQAFVTAGASSATRKAYISADVCVTFLQHPRISRRVTMSPSPSNFRNTLKVSQ